MENTQDTLYGKMYPEHSQVKKDKTSEQCSKKSLELKMKPLLFLSLKTENGHHREASWQMISPSHGERLMLNTSESPNVGVVSTLSQILEKNVPEKYYLSTKACLGILRRASARGKELPQMLKTALERQAQMLSQ